MNSKVWAMGIVLFGGAELCQAQTQTNAPGLNAGNGPADSPVATARNYGEIDAGTANSKATLSVAIDYAPAKSGIAPSFTTLSLSGSAPLGNSGGSSSSGSNSTQLATLDGLANSTNATFKLIGFWVKTRTPSNDELQHFCGAVEAAGQRAIDAKRPDKVDLKRCSFAKKLDATCGVGKKPCCSTNNAKLLSCMGLLPAADADDVSFWASPVTWAAGTSATVGTKSFQFLAPATAASTTENKIPWSAQIFAATQWAQNLVTAGLRYQESYKDANTGSLCPQAKSYPVTCKTGPLGEPIKTDSPISYLEYRQRFSAHLAIDPSVNYDLEHHIWGINVPVYLVGDGKGKLTGGASAGWRSDQGGLQFGIFVGSAFSLSPQS